MRNEKIMTVRPLFTIIAASALNLSCADKVGTTLNPAGAAGSSESGGSGGNAGSSAVSAPDAVAFQPTAAFFEPDAATFEPPHHLGKPFTLVGGAMSADQNDQGLEAVFFSGSNDSSSLAVTSTTGQICVNGEVSRALVGDTARYWGFSIGFVTRQGGGAPLPEPDAASPASEPWALSDRVRGIAATISGPTAPSNLIFEATPGGLDPTGQSGIPQQLTLYADCSPSLPAPGQRVKAFFAQLQNVWCTAGLRTPWIGDSVDSTSIWVPSLRTRTDSTVSIVSPLRNFSLTALNSSSRPAGLRIAIEFPIISAAL